MAVDLQQDTHLMQSRQRCLELQRRHTDYARSAARRFDPASLLCGAATTGIRTHRRHPAEQRAPMLAKVKQIEERKQRTARQCITRTWKGTATCASGRTWMWTCLCSSAGARMYGVRAADGAFDKVAAI